MILLSYTSTEESIVRESVLTKSLFLKACLLLLLSGAVFSSQAAADAAANESGPDPNVNEEILKKKAELIQAYLRQVRALQIEKKYDQAIASLDEALALDDDNPALHALRDMLLDASKAQKARAADRPRGLDDNPGELEADRAAQAALRKIVTLSNDNLSLGQVIAFIRDTTGVNIAVNWPALELVGIDQDSLVTVSLSRVPAEQLLRVVLAQASAGAFGNDKAGFTVSEGIVKISILRDLKSETETRVYSLEKYLAAARGDIAESTLVDQFTDLITTNVGDPDEWLDEDSTIVETNGKLSIKTSAGNHWEIAALFDQIDNPVENAKDIESKADRAAEALLGKKLSLSNDNLPLSMVIDFVRDTTGLNLAVNWPALELVGTDRDSLVTLDIKRVPADQLLRLALDQVSADAFDDDKAGFAIREGVIHITTLRELNGHTQIRVYKLRRWIGSQANDQNLVDQVCELITTGVGDPDEWLDEESTLMSLQGLLIVNTTSKNHRQIVGLLGRLGETR